MSLRELDQALGPLPFALREQIVGYARAVDAAAPEIAQEANITLTSKLREDLAFLAGVRKFYAICVSSYWAIDNANRFIVYHEVDSIRMGGADYSRASELYRGLRRTADEFRLLLEQYELANIRELSYKDLLVQLANGR